MTVGVSRAEIWPGVGMNDCAQSRDANSVKSCREMLAFSYRMWEELSMWFFSGLRLFLLSSFCRFVRLNLRRFRVIGVVGGGESRKSIYGG